MEDERWAFIVEGSENTWSRAARRKRKRGHDDTGGITEPPQKVSISDGKHPVERQAGGDITAGNEPQKRLDDHFTGVRCRISHKERDVIECQWMRGNDTQLFQGLWSHICRKMKENVNTK